MNLVLLLKEDLVSPDRAVLTGRRHEHIRKVLKSSPGDDLCVGMADGKIGTGRIISIDGRSVSMGVSLHTDPPEGLPVTLVLAMPRPIVFNRILAHITSLGIKKIIVIHSARTEKSYWSSPVLREGNIRDQFILGLEQAKDTVMPEITFIKKFRQFADKDLCDMAGQMRVFLADPDADIPMPSDVKEECTVIIGPEGGFIPGERDIMKKAGCLSVNMGKRILRTETAVIAAISRLS